MREFNLSDLVQEFSMVLHRSCIKDSSVDLFAVWVLHLMESSSSSVAPKPLSKAQNVMRAGL